MLSKCPECSLEVVPRVDGSCPSCGASIEEGSVEGDAEEIVVPEAGVAEEVKRYHSPTPPKSGCATMAVVAGWGIVLVAGWRLFVRVMFALKFGTESLNLWTSFVLPVAALIYGFWMTRMDFSEEEYWGSPGDDEEPGEDS